MRFLHIADLHIGKSVLEMPMLEDQRYILKAVVAAAVENNVDAVLIAGDIYDRSVPPAEAVCVLDDFLSILSEKGITVIAVAGNHDSPERLEFGSRLLAGRGVHIAGIYNGNLRSVTLCDEHGPVHFYTLPFVKPAIIRAVLGEDVSNTAEAVRAALQGYPITSHADDRNVLVAHQFVCHGEHAPDTCDSEIHSVGGSDSVDVSCFDGFDYVALGHLHRAQHISLETIRYSGSPLKYSLSEVRHTKSLTLVTLGEKGQVEIDLIPVNPPHDLRRIKGRLEDLITAAKENPDGRHDYIHAVLTERDVLDPAARLRMVYPNLMHVEIELHQSEFEENIGFDPMEQKSELQLFEDFFRQVNGTELNSDQNRIIQTIMANVKGEDFE
jgi:exonuclease SbcD